MSVTTTREAHMEWAKARALDYLPGDPRNAAMSFLSDLGKHPETENHVARDLIVMHMAGDLLNERTARELIEGTR